MTKEEIIRLLENAVETVYERPQTRTAQAIEETIKMLKQEPCDDAISRQEAIKAIEALQRPIMREESNYYQFKFSGMSEAREVVVNLPPVQPQPKTGHWIMHERHRECSECGVYLPKDMPRNSYCPNCGAKMER